MLYRLWRVSDDRIGLGAVHAGVQAGGGAACAGRQTVSSVGKTLGLSDQTLLDWLKAESAPVEILPPPSPRTYWTRKGVSGWLVERLAKDVATLVGIDHGFSFPLRYFEAHRLEDWPGFLDDFQRHLTSRQRRGAHGRRSLATANRNSRWRERLVNFHPHFGRTRFRLINGETPERHDDNGQRAASTIFRSDHDQALLAPFL